MLPKIEEMRPPGVSTWDWEAFIDRIEPIIREDEQQKFRAIVEAMEEQIRQDEREKIARIVDAENAKAIGPVDSEYTLGWNDAIKTTTETVADALADLGRRGGLARAKKLTPERRSEIARDGAKSRWEK